MNRRLLRADGTIQHPNVTVITDESIPAMARNRDMLWLTYTITL